MKFVAGLLQGGTPAAVKAVETACNLDGAVIQHRAEQGIQLCFERQLHGGLDCPLYTAQGYPSMRLFLVGYSAARDAAKDSGNSFVGSQRAAVAVGDHNERSKGLAEARILAEDLTAGRRVREVLQSAGKQRRDGLAVGRYILHVGAQFTHQLKEALFPETLEVEQTS
ncbi:MAG: hypothetical protein H0X25_12450 [Acidobacteriales bacterium]|nr:hypothetical protein [Terriglobales bacterium]